MWFRIKLPVGSPSDHGRSPESSKVSESDTVLFVSSDSRHLVELTEEVTIKLRSKIQIVVW